MGEMTDDELAMDDRAEASYLQAHEKARLAHDRFVGNVVAQTALLARQLHRDLGLPADVVLTFDESGMRRVCHATSEAWPGRYCELDPGHGGPHKADLGVLTVTYSDPE